MTHRTEGKITYIHEGPLPDLSHALLDPALQRQPKPIPVIAIGDDERIAISILAEGHWPESPDDLAKPKPNEPTVTAYYGGPADGYMHPSEPDEFDVWGTSQNTSPTSQQRLNWPLIWLWFSIIAACALAWYLAALILLQTGVPDFITHILITTITPTT